MRRCWMVVEVVVVLVEAEHACEVAQLSVCDLRATMSSPLSALDLRCLARCCCGLNQKKRRQVYQTLVCILNSLLLICFILGFLYGFYYKKRETRHGSPVMKAIHIFVQILYSSQRSWGCCWWDTMVFFISEGCFFIQFLRSLAKRLFIIVEKKTVQGAKGKEDADKILETTVAEV